MKFSRFPLLLLWSAVVTALPACLSLQSEEQKAADAEKNVLANHDALMSRMDQLYDLRQELQHAALPDTLETGRRRRSLLGADAAMMNWMHQYHKPADSVPPDQRLTYFEAQQRILDSVGTLMDHSIDSAKLVLRRASAAQPSAQ